MPTHPPPAVELSGLRKAFGATLAVDGLDLVVPAGQVLALLGPNGAGKSTTVDMLLGLAPPDAGTVEVWGRPPGQACRAGLVGALLQTGGLLGSVTVTELVDTMRALSPHPLPLEQVVDTARIGDIAGQRADRLSGGQTQRVRFALAIAGDPELLVLDEPTVAMDVSTRRGFWAAMREWTGRGRTVLFATHYLEEADAYADRVVLMARGRVVADGTAAAIKARVGGRTISAGVPGATTGALGRLKGVTQVEAHGERFLLRCADSDGALRELLGAFPGTHDIEVTSGGLEEAFVALTEDQPGKAHQPVGAHQLSQAHQLSEEDL
ncbi:ABC transporter ATP-binding protein [Acidiferrimicrobium sp. IK]|uniref:ABC transporter ATP-binding protein n=1 Tax=Acidiferrimicrobium sp. IK TaxID=2871700 RepID=UPI0021CAEDA4|nr:ABC transporter ATP-binding protein [Acidiferrimicrobium sp. IK]MCU4185317.1 ABC transporter ATP-binding protein [Acidiferrimicrobium sp. IK]